MTFGYMLMLVKPGRVFTSLTMRLAVLAQKKVDAGQALAAERAEGLDRQLANLVADFGGKVGRDLDRGALIVEIFGLVGVEAVAVAGHDLARRRGGERTVLVLENAALDLAAANIFLDQDLAVMPKRLGDRLSELLRRPRLADADRRAKARRLDEHRTAELGDDRLKGRLVSPRKTQEARDRQAAVAHETFGDILVHRRGRAEDAGTDIRHARNFRDALDRSILAEGAMQNREDDVDRARQVGRRRIRLRKDGEPPGAARNKDDARSALGNGDRKRAAFKRA